MSNPERDMLDQLGYIIQPNIATVGSEAVGIWTIVFDPPSVTPLTPFAWSLARSFFARHTEVLSHKFNRLEVPPTLLWEAAIMRHANPPNFDQWFRANKGLLPALLGAANNRVAVLGQMHPHLRAVQIRRLMGGAKMDALKLASLPESKAFIKAVNKIEGQFRVGLIRSIVECFQVKWQRRWLHYAPNITPDLIRLLKRCPREHVNWKLVHQASLTPWDCYDVSLSAMELHRSFIKRHGNSPWPYRGLDLEGIRRARDKLLLQEEGELPLPAPPIPDTENIKALRRPVDLLREGRVMRNCIFSLRNTMREKGWCAYQMLKPYRATIMLIPNENYFVLTEFSGVKNQMPPDEAWKEVLDWLSASQGNIDQLHLQFCGP